MGIPKTLFLLFLYTLHKWKLLSLAKLHRYSFHMIFKGKEKSFYQSLVQEQVKNDFTHKRCPKMRKIFESSRSAGETYLVSASPDFIVEAYARMFQVDGYFATEYCTDAKGEFTHVGNIVDGAAKWGFAKKKIDGRVSYAYSDDLADKVLLDNVTHGVLVK